MKNLPAVRKFKLGALELKVRTVNLIAVFIILAMVAGYAIGRNSGYKDGYSGAQQDWSKCIRPEQTRSIYEFGFIAICAGIALGLTFHGFPFAFKSETHVEVNLPKNQFEH